MLGDTMYDTAELPTPCVEVGPGPAEFADQLAAALHLVGGGDRDAARAWLGTLWNAYGPGVGSALPRALLAHHLAGLHEDDPVEELRWNRRALQAAQLTTDAQLAAWGMPIPARALFPLLHLRLARCHQRSGDLAAARDHVRHARTWAPALPRDAYGDRVRAELSRVADHLDMCTPPGGTHRATRIS